MSWQPVPSWVEGWANKWDLIKAPLRLLEQWYAGWFLASTLYAIVMFAAYQHTKSGLGVAVVALLLAGALSVVPELRWLAFFSLLLGVAGTLWEFAKRWIVSR